MQALLAESNLDLREARYEITQLQSKESKWTNDRNVLERTNTESIVKLKDSIELMQREAKQRITRFYGECESIAKLITVASKSIRNNSHPAIPKTTNQIFSQAIVDIETMKESTKSFLGVFDSENVDINNIIVPEVPIEVSKALTVVRG